MVKYGIDYQSQSSQTWGLIVIMLEGIQHRWIPGNSIVMCSWSNDIYNVSNIAIRPLYFFLQSHLVSKVNACYSFDSWPTIHRLPTLEFLINALHWSSLPQQLMQILAMFTRIVCCCTCEIQKLLHNSLHDCCSNCFQTLCVKITSGFHNSNTLPSSAFLINYWSLWWIQTSKTGKVPPMVAEHFKVQTSLAAHLLNCTHQPQLSVQIFYICVKWPGALISDVQVVKWKRCLCDARSHKHSLKCHPSPRPIPPRRPRRERRLNSQRDNAVPWRHLLLRKLCAIMRYIQLFEIWRHECWSIKASFLCIVRREIGRLLQDQRTWSFFISCRIWNPKTSDRHHYRRVHSHLLAMPSEVEEEKVAGGELRGHYGRDFRSSVQPQGLMVPIIATPTKGQQPTPRASSTPHRAPTPCASTSTPASTMQPRQLEPGVTVSRLILCWTVLLQQANLKRKWKYADFGHLFADAVSR